MSQLSEIAVPRFERFDYLELGRVLGSSEMRVEEIRLHPGQHEESMTVVMVADWKMISRPPRAIASAVHSILLASLLFLCGARAVAQKPSNDPPKSVSPPAQAHINVSPTRLDFGSQQVDSMSSARAIALSASESLRVKIDGPDGEFSASPKECQLGGATPCAVDVTFAPKRPGRSNSYLTLTVTSENNSHSSTTILSLTGTGVTRCNPENTLFSRAWIASMGAVSAVLFLYLLWLVLGRWNMVALPTRRLLQAQIDAVTKRVEALPTTSAGQAPAGTAQITSLLTTARGLIADRGFLSMIPDYLLWTRGEELAGWGYVHEAEEQLIFLLPLDSVRVGLERTEMDLRQAASPTALALADRIHEALSAVPPLPLDRCRAVLQEVLTSLTPRPTTLASEISKALDSAADTTPQQCHDLAVSLISFLNPQNDVLATQIRQTLASSPPPDAATLTPLLRQVMTHLETRAVPLSQGLMAAVSSSTPLTVAQWQPVLAKARDFLTPQASVLAESIRRTLAAEPDMPLMRWRALLAEALGLLYDRTDTGFATLISWHNKTMWLVGCGLLLIASLAATLQHEVLFLVGAAGGLLSRLSRSLSRADVPTDYGASWTWLFLSPVVGALAGWSGILLLITAKDLNVLGPAVNIDWCDPFRPFALGVALLLGFSERAFVGILTQLETKVQTPVGTSPSQPAKPLTIVTAPRLPGGAVGKPYDQRIVVSGGTPPYKWSLAAGVLPAGLTLAEATGGVGGTPLAPGGSAFTLQASDTTSKTSQAFTLEVVKEP